MFDRDLFDKLCREYGVRFSADCAEPMLQEGGTIRKITADDIEQLAVPVSGCRIQFQPILDYELDYDEAA